MEKQSSGVQLGMPQALGTLLWGSNAWAGTSVQGVLSLGTKCQN